MANTIRGQVEREALRIMEVLNNPDYGARHAMTHLYQRGIHNPAVRRATEIAGVDERHLFNVSRAVNPNELVQWIGRERLLPGALARGMLESRDLALYDDVGRVGTQEVMAAARNVNRFRQTLHAAVPKDFLTFPYPHFSQQHMSREFRQHWTTGRNRRGR